MKIPVFFVDAFTDELFKGNPAAVCLLKEEISEQLMQKIAFEIGFSETCFCFPHENEKEHYALRWFTPETEVSLCGHGTLATAFVLWNQKPDLGVIIHFHTKSGIMPVLRKDNTIILDFPVYSVKQSDIIYHSLEESLGLAGTGRRFFQSEESGYLLLEIELDELKNLDIDFNKMLKTNIDPYTSFIVTAKGDQAYDFYSRCFAVWEGNNEDPVTGSAHTLLIDYWHKKFPDKYNFKAYQFSKRGGELNLKLKKNRVFISGNVVLFMEGFINI